MGRLILDRVAACDTAVADLDDQIRSAVARWRQQVAFRVRIPGFGEVTAWTWSAQTGPAPHPWSGSREKLACGTGLAPGHHISAGKREPGRTGDAGTCITPALVQAAWAAIRVPGRRQARSSRLVRRFGGEKNPGSQAEGPRGDRAHPAEDRLLGPDIRPALPGAGRGLLHPPPKPPEPAGLARSRTPQAAPRPPWHGHHRTRR
jgi:hypothetical protein